MCLLSTRRDKYQPTIKEYWVDVATTGSFEEEHEESLTDRTTGEGTACSLNLGLPANELASPGHDPAGEDTDREIEEDDDGSTVHRIPGRSDVEKESALEACHVEKATLCQYVHTLE